MAKSADWFRPLGDPLCPRCYDEGEIDSVVMYTIDDDVIKTLRCRECGFTDKPGEFKHD